MALDEQLRQLAAEVPPPPPGDSDGTFRRGVRRRRIRHATSVITVVTVIAVLGVGVASLIQRPTVPGITDQPTQPSPTGASDFVLSADEPFRWAVTVSARADGRWCASHAIGHMNVLSHRDVPCVEVLTPEQAGLPDGLGPITHVVLADTASGPPTQGLSWGFAPSPIDEVIVLLTDGTQASARLASHHAANATLWAIGYVGTEIQVVEARRSGTVVAGGIPETNVPDDGRAAPPREVFGDTLQPQELSAFPDSHRGLFDLRPDDALFWLPVDDTGRVGIRARDGFAPLMFSTPCDVLSRVELPDGWLGLCLEYTAPDRGRVRGMFPHGTTSGR